MINLTIHSLNNKSITAIDLANNSVVAYFNQSTPTPLDYTNIMVKVQTANTFTLGNLGHVARQIPEDWIYLFIAFSLIACVVATAWLFKRR